MSRPLPPLPPSPSPSPSRRRSSASNATPTTSPVPRHPSTLGIVAWRARFPLDVALVAVREDMPEAAKLAQVLLRAGITAAFCEPPPDPGPAQNKQYPEEQPSTQSFINKARIAVLWVSEQSASRMWNLLEIQDLTTQLLPIYLAPVSVLIHRRRYQTMPSPPHHPPPPPPSPPPLDSLSSPPRRLKFADQPAFNHDLHRKHPTPPPPVEQINNKPDTPHPNYSLPSGYQFTSTPSPTTRAALHRDVAILVFGTLDAERSTGWRLVEFSPDKDAPYTAPRDVGASPVELIRRIRTALPVDAADKDTALAELAAATSGASIAGSAFAPQGAGSGTLLDFGSSHAVDRMETRWNGTTTLQVKSTLAIRDAMAPFLRPERTSRHNNAMTVTVLLLGWDNAAALTQGQPAPSPEPRTHSSDMASSSFNSFVSENHEKKNSSVIITVAIKRRIHVPLKAWSTFCTQFKRSLDRGRSIEWSYADAIAQAARLPENSQDINLSAFQRYQELYHKNIVLKSPTQVSTTPLTRELMRRGSIIPYLHQPATKIVFFSIRSLEDFFTLTKIMSTQNHTLLSVNRQRDGHGTQKGTTEYIAALQLPVAAHEFSAQISCVEGPVTNQQGELEFLVTAATAKAVSRTNFNPLNVLYEDWDRSILAHTIHLHYEKSTLRFDDLISMYAPTMAGVQFSSWDASSGILTVKCSALARSRLLTSVRFLRRAAGAGNAIAQCNLGAALQNQSRGIEKADPESALRLFHLAATQKNPVALSNLGLAYQYGFGVEANMTEAVKWLQLAARFGDSFARYDLANMYFRGVPGVLSRQDSVGMRLLYLAASEGCNPKAQNDLGLEYESGLRLKGDLGEAAIWYSLAADQGGNPVAMVNLANCFFYGGSTASVCQDYQAASYWYGKALERLNDIVAAQNLAVCYSLGLGTMQSAKKALELSRTVADRVSWPSVEDGFFLKSGLSTRLPSSAVPGHCVCAGSCSVEQIDGRPLGIFVMAEAHGGPAAVELCEKNAIPIFLAAWQRSPEQIMDLMQETFQILQTQVEEAWRDSFASLCIFVVRDGITYCGHVGKCRAVLSRDGHGVMLSDEHLPETRPDEIEKIKRTGATTENLRLTRALGDAISNEPEISVNPIGLVAELLVIATHNFWVKYTSDGAVRLARGYLKRYRGNAQRVAEKLTRDGDLGGVVSVMIIVLDPRGSCIEITGSSNVKSQNENSWKQLIPPGLRLAGSLRSSLSLDSGNKVPLSSSRKSSYTTDFWATRSTSRRRSHYNARGQNTDQLPSGRLSGSGRFRFPGRVRR